MMRDLDSIISEAKEIMERTIEKIRQYNEHNVRHPENKRTYGELRSAIDREIINFDGYWKTVYNWVSEKLGEKKAKELQKQMLNHHYEKTQNKGCEASLEYIIGFDITWDEYRQIIREIDPEEKFIPGKKWD